MSISARGLAMSLTNYQLGRAFEYRVRDLLKEHGWYVTRSAQSKGPADLVAVQSGVIMFVQCKRDGKMGPKEWNEFWDVCQRAGAIPILARTKAKRRGTELMELTQRKRNRVRTQPMRAFDMYGWDSYWENKAVRADRY